MTSTISDLKKKFDQVPSLLSLFFFPGLLSKFKSFRDREGRKTVLITLL